MDVFEGKLAELKLLLKEAGYEGGWAVIAHGYQFRARDGSRVSWFPEFGNRLFYSGSSEAVERLRGALGAGRGDPAPPAEGHPEGGPERASR